MEKLDLWIVVGIVVFALMWSQSMVMEGLENTEAPKDVPVPAPEVPVAADETLDKRCYIDAASGSEFACPEGYECGCTTQLMGSPACVSHAATVFGVNIPGPVGKCVKKVVQEK